MTKTMHARCKHRPLKRADGISPTSPQRRPAEENLEQDEKVELEDTSFDDENVFVLVH